MSNEFKFDVFLSHSAIDKPVVRDIAARLKNDAVRVWFDEEQIQPGDSIPTKIEDGLENSRVLVLCMSSNAFGSDWTQLESGTFRFRDPMNKERRFIPLRLDDAPIRGSLAQFRYVEWSSELREQAYRELRDACKSVAVQPAILVRLAKSEESHHEEARPIPQVQHAPLKRPIGEVWGGIRGLIQQEYSTKIIKEILGKAGLPIHRINYSGTFKGPVLDEADKLVSLMEENARDDFVVGCIEEVLALEHRNIGNHLERETKLHGHIVNGLRAVLTRFGYDLSEFASRDCQ